MVDKINSHRMFNRYNGFLAKNSYFTSKYYCRRYKYNEIWFEMIIFAYFLIQISTKLFIFLPSYDMLSDIYLVALSTSTPVLNHQ